MKFITKQPLWLKMTGLLILALAIMWGARKGTPPVTGATFVSRRGPLDINVLQGGVTEALESQSVKCEVRGNQGQGTKILKIVEEGYLVTDEDIRTNKVLVELDSSEIKKLITQHDITFEATAAALTDAQQAYEIQLNQNRSDIKAAEQKAKFALLDVEKFMGDTAAKEILEKLNSADARDESSTNSLKTTSLAESLKRQIIDYSRYTNQSLLGDGEAKQKIRKYEDDLQQARKEWAQFQTALEGTQRLHKRGFVTKTELETDEFKFENGRLKVQTAETAQSLFMKYDFPKSSEEFLSKYQEAVRELERTRKSAISKLAQADAKLKSAQGRYNLEVKQRQDLGEQLDKCLVKATKPGLITYANNYYGEEPMREGTIVREQQPMIVIPNLSLMGIKVRIHESYIKKVQKGQKAKITADAFPEIRIEGEVTKVSVLPDSQSRWMNPDMNVYQTTIKVTTAHDWIKPGMSIKAEIMVKQLTNVVYIPIQAVTFLDGKQMCMVESSAGQERRVVEVGDFNDEFIEIRNGLKEGEKVFLQALEPLQKDMETKSVPVAVPDTKTVGS